MSKKNKMFCLRWNLLPRLIRICWICWCCSRFETKISFLGIFGLKNLCAIWNFFWSGNTIFWANLVNQIKITCSRRNWLPRIWWQCSLFLLWTRNSLYGHNWSEKNQNCIKFYQIYWIGWWNSFFCFGLEIPFFGQIFSIKSNVFI